jgi:hypothetical protein
MRANLREMRPFFAKSLPGILARFYDKVRHYDPALGHLRGRRDAGGDPPAAAALDLIAAGDFGTAYTGSVTRICEFHQQSGVAPQWYVGCRLMFVGETDAGGRGRGCDARFGRTAQAAARDEKAAMLNAITKANMLDAENTVAVYFGANRQIGKNTIAAASDRFRAIITSLSSASGELEGTAHSLSDNAGNTTRLATVVANASAEASDNVQSVASATEELASSVREISAQVQESNRIAASA